jgi:ubiquinone/menaquinone biosynthesis C-methylase UbiE
MTVSERLPFPDASFDIYLSVSVIEHTHFKKEAIEEAARVIKPGGLLILTFDICEKDMGMTYPREFGIPWDMSKFDEIFSTLPFLNPLDKNVQWNTEVIQNFLIWHQTTKPIHNYVIGAAVFRRTGREVPPRNRYKSSILKLKILDRYYFRPSVINILQKVWGKIQRI